jgi:hypothetical protein
MRGGLVGGGLFSCSGNRDDHTTEEDKTSVLLINGGIEIRMRIGRRFGE